jgi:hypothetical protein
MTLLSYSFRQHWPFSNAHRFLRNLVKFVRHHSCLKINELWTLLSDLSLTFFFHNRELITHTVWGIRFAETAVKTQIVGDLLGGIRNWHINWGVIQWNVFHRVFIYCIELFLHLNFLKLVLQRDLMWALFSDVNLLVIYVRQRILNRPKR